MHIERSGQMKYLTLATALILTLPAQVITETKKNPAII